MIWPCLDEHPPDCLPLERNGCPPTRRRLLRTACRRQGRKSQFHCDEQALTVAEVFSLTAGSVCARTPTSFAATPTNEHTAMFDARSTRKHREKTYLAKSIRNRRLQTKYQARATFPATAPTAQLA